MRVQFYKRSRKKWEPPAETVAEWERALYAPRTLTGALCGDPMLGRSALEKRMSEPRCASLRPPEGLVINGRQFRYRSRPVTLAKVSR